MKVSNPAVKQFPCYSDLMQNDYYCSTHSSMQCHREGLPEVIEKPASTCQWTPPPSRASRSSVGLFLPIQLTRKGRIFENHARYFRGHSWIWHLSLLPIFHWLEFSYMLPSISKDIENCSLPGNPEIWSSHGTVCLRWVGGVHFICQPNLN